MNLEEAIRNIYNIMFSPEKNISVFSSQTGQTLTETIEYLHSSEGLTEDEENNGVKFNYNLNFTLIPMGERYRQYCNNVFKTDLDLPTIHMVLEVILFYSSYTGRSSEVEDVMYAYLEQYLDQTLLIKAVRIVVNNDLVNRLESSLGQIYDAIHGILFCGWTIKPDSINFYNNYDVLIRSERGL